MTDSAVEAITQAIRDGKSRNADMTRAILQALQLGYTLGQQDSQKAG